MRLNNPVDPEQIPQGKNDVRTWLCDRRRDDEKATTPLREIPVNILGVLPLKGLVALQIPTGSEPR